MGLILVTPLKSPKSIVICLVCIYQVEFWGPKLDNQALGVAKNYPQPEKQRPLQMVYLVLSLFSVILGPYGTSFLLSE